MINLIPIDPLIKKKLFDRTFVRARSPKKRCFLSLEMKIFLKQTFEKVFLCLFHFFFNSF